MSREQMMELVKSSGMPFTPEFLDSLSDDQLAGLIACMTPNAGDGSGNPDPTDPNAGAMASHADDDPDTVANADGAGAAGGGAAGGGVAPAASNPGGLAAAGANLPVPTALTLKFRDMQTASVRIEKRLAASDRLAAQRLSAEKEATINRLWGDFLKAEVRVPSQERTTKDYLRKCDAVNVVAKFADLPGAGPMTEMEAAAKRILAEPKVVKFGERMQQDAPAQNKPMTAERRRFLMGRDPVGRAILKDAAKTA